MHAHRLRPPVGHLFPVLGTVVLLAISCGDAEVGGGASGIINVDQLPRLTAVEELRIGSVLNPDSGFSDIRLFDVDDDGAIYVFEERDRQIRVYDASGSELRRIGRRGSGPGEFQGPVTAMGVTGDIVWAYQPLLAERLTLYRRTGELISTAPLNAVRIRMPPPSNRVGKVSPIAMREDGLFWGDLVSYSTSSSPAIPVADSFPRVLYSADGEPVDTAGWIPIRPSMLRQRRHVEAGGRSILLPSPDLDDPFVQSLGDDLLFVIRPAATADTLSRFRIVRLTMSRDTIFDREYEYSPQRYTRAHLDELALRAVNLFAGRSTRGAVVPFVESDDGEVSAVRAAMNFPEFRPPISFASPGADGGFWLMHLFRDGMGYIVYDRDGTPIWRLDNGVGGWHSGDTVISVQRDSQDVPFLVRYRLQAAPKGDPKR